MFTVNLPAVRLAMTIIALWPGSRIYEQLTVQPGYFNG